jgi:hypothetical protein
MKPATSLWPLANGGWHQAMHHLEAREREEADPSYHQDAIDYRV